VVCTQIQREETRALYADVQDKQDEKTELRNGPVSMLGGYHRPTRVKWAPWNTYQERHPRSSTVGMAPDIRQRRRQVKEAGKSDAEAGNR
jgi:hypothetical protein